MNSSLEQRAVGGLLERLTQQRGRGQHALRVADHAGQAVERVRPRRARLTQMDGRLQAAASALVIEAPLQTAASRYRSALDRLKPWLAGQMK